MTVVLGLGTKGARGASSYNFGDFLISLSVINWAAFMVLTRWLFKENRYPPVFTIFWEIFFAVLMCLPALALTGTDISVSAGLDVYKRQLSNTLRPQWIGTELSHDVLNPAHVPLLSLIHIRCV